MNHSHTSPELNATRTTANDNQPNPNPNPNPNPTSNASWPSPPGAGPLGDGRCAFATDRPVAAAELSETVARRVTEGWAIYPQGGGTCLEYGGIPEKPGTILNLTGLDQVVDYPSADMTITIQAGMTLSALQNILHQAGQFLPLDAPGPDRATLGGIFATNTSGARRFGWGRPRDHIIGISFVNAKGEILRGGGRVVKNVAGYDFPKLQTGALGTLGAIVEMTLKVRPRPESQACLWIPFHNLAGIAQCLDRLNLSQTRPTAVELINRPAALAIQKRLGQPLPVSDYVLILGYEDNADSVAWQLDRMTIELGRIDMPVLRDDASRPLWRELTDAIDPGHDHADQVDHGDPASGRLAFVVNLTRSAVPSFLEPLKPERWSVLSHAGNGIIRAKTVEPTSWDLLGPELDALRARAVNHGGNLVVTQCPTGWKSRIPLWGTPRPDWAIGRMVKSALDPLNVFNPGRFVGNL